ncbi:MAG: ParG [Leptolyngbya sp. SIO1E4]|nr:ParG [Leptolyngbya sp. SIO1E4]
MLSATMCVALTGMMADKIVAIRVQMPNTLRAKFKAQCALKDKSMNEVVVELIEQWLSESEDPVA